MTTPTRGARRSLFRLPLSLIAALGLLTLLPIGACDCGDDLGSARAQIAVAPNPIDYGTRHVAAGHLLPISIGNNGSAGLRLSDVRIEPADAPFTIGTLPGQIGPRLIGELPLTFTPPEQGTFEATLIIESNTLAVPGLTTTEGDIEVARVPITGIAGPPLITPDPASVDYGVVNQGPGELAEIRLQNTGHDVLNISEIRLENPGAGVAFQFVDGQMISGAVAPGSQMTVGVIMNPSAESVAAAVDGVHEAKVVVESDAENTPLLEIPLTASANLAPTAVNVELHSRRSEVKVGIEVPVVFDGSESMDPEGDLFTFEWSIVEAPADTTAFLEASGLPSDGSQIRIRPKEVGRYVVRLRAIDMHGAYSEADAVVLPRDLAVVLRWVTADDAACQSMTDEQCAALPAAERRTRCCGQSDLDIHLVRPMGMLGDYGDRTLCQSAMCLPAGTALSRCYEDAEDFIDTCRQSGSDCAYANRYPEWGDVGREDDPRLDLDDVRGEGPEVVTVNRPLDGTYQAVVHYCDDRIGEPSMAMVDVYVEGELRHTAGPQRIESEGQAWVAASLTRVGGPEDGTWTFSSTPDQFTPAPADLCQ